MRTIIWHKDSRDCKCSDCCPALQLEGNPAVEIKEALTAQQQVFITNDPDLAQRLQKASEIIRERNH